MIPLGFFSKEKWELLSLLERSLLPSLVQTPVPVYFNITSAICIAISVCKQSIFSASTWTKQNCALTHQIPVFMSNHKCLNHIAQGKLTESFLHSLVEWERIRSASKHEGKVYACEYSKSFSYKPPLNYLNWRLFCFFSLSAIIWLHHKHTLWSVGFSPEGTTEQKESWNVISKAKDETGSSSTWMEPSIVITYTHESSF